MVGAHVLYVLNCGSGTAASTEALQIDDIDKAVGSNTGGQAIGPFRKCTSCSLISDICCLNGKSINWNNNQRFYRHTVCLKQEPVPQVGWRSQKVLRGQTKKFLVLAFLWVSLKKNIE